MTDWLPHDGQDCPVPDRSCPAVRFRRKAYGMRKQLEIAMGSTEARKWLDYGGRNCWQWLPDSEEPYDIVAYRVEPDDWVTVPRYPESVSI